MKDIPEDAYPKEDWCDMSGPYFVFHGVSVSRDPFDHEYPSSGRANTTIVGHGAQQDVALRDAKLHEARRGRKGHDFGGVAHVSGPHGLRTPS